MSRGRGGGASDRRLRSRREFRLIYRKGVKCVEDRMVVYGFVNGCGPSKLGITVSKKWGKACKRNRFKRVVREGYGRIRALLPEHMLLNVHPSREYESLTPDDVAKALRRCCV
ncbi:MAG: ribonuclease P protein component [Simkaniaceae bacterium]|nr:ribonuclease P protein component [Simkaniaceae bacterium]